MTHRLYLLRHAEAESWNPLGNDFSRPLSSIGTRHAQSVSRWALETLSPPDTILCSPARRTRETLAPLLALWPRLLATTDYVDSMYGASLNMLLTLAEDAFSYSECLLMVGHNPGIEQMLLNLAHPKKAVGTMQMGTGTLAVIEFSDGFKQRTPVGNLLNLMRKEHCYPT
jgi:phosphohistidine phosphatase